MSRNPESNWNPAEAVQVTPEEYELQVREWLERAGEELEDFSVTHREPICGDSGEYQIDVVARFRAFHGAMFTVLIECKRWNRPIERDLMIVLAGKVRDTGAHKGMMFSTCGFQRGAIEYAANKGIATVAFTDGIFNYETLSSARVSARPAYRPPGTPRFLGVFYEPGQFGPSSSYMTPDRLDPLSAWIEMAKTDVFHGEA